MAVYQLLDVFRWAEEDGGTLVYGLWLHVQDGHGARGGHAARLLHDEGHRVTLVHQPQLHRTETHGYEQHVYRKIIGKL